MTIDLRGSYKGNSTTVLYDIISENSMEYWCYPYVSSCMGKVSFGTLYVNKDSEYGQEIAKLLKSSPIEIADINDYCLEIMCKHLSATDLHSFMIDISEKSKTIGKECLQHELRRVIGY